MDKPRLTVDRLLANGFKELACWELNSARDLIHGVDVPKAAGVYAFAVDGIVHYVGLASKSLRQRLGFYRKPGASQSTNVRMNEIIRGQINKGTIVQILVAQPPNQSWNGFTISGVEGLEAGLISQFDLPWNIRGAAQGMNAAATPTSAVRSNGNVPLDVRILELVGRKPGLTELEIARAIFGSTAVQ